MAWPDLLGSEIDVQVRGILENQDTFFAGDLKNGLTAFLTERKPTRVVAVWHGVIQRYKVTLLARGSDLRPHHLWKRTLIVHIHTENRGVLAQSNPRRKTGIGRRIGDVGHLLARMLKHGANQVDAA